MGATMATSTTNKSKMYLTTAGVLAFGVAAYGLGRVYPPMGPSAGTIAPAQRYVSAQVGEGDVTLGDTAVPELMQTDAFELMTHDANFRAFAASPGFKAIAGQPQAMAALAANPAAFASFASSASAFQNAASKAASNAQMASSASAFQQLAGNPAAMSALKADPQVFSAI